MEPFQVDTKKHKFHFAYDVLGHKLASHEDDVEIIYQCMGMKKCLVLSAYKSGNRGKNDLLDLLSVVTETNAVASNESVFVDKKKYYNMVSRHEWIGFPEIPCLILAEPALNCQDHSFRDMPIAHFSGLLIPCFIHPKPALNCQDHSCRNMPRAHSLGIILPCLIHVESSVNCQDHSCRDVPTAMLIPCLFHTEAL